MAVVQISRIQHRKGLQQDLPQLASAEFGWAIDSRRLYIGNGTIGEGAPVQGVTEILTQYSDILNISNNYTFKGAQSGYTSLTGVTALTPTQRTQQQKLDDIVNVRDFGATGNGTTDDTLAIQRAIDQIYFGNFAITTPKLRRSIYFPAGVYRITQSLTLPSYAILLGEGRERSTISMSGNYAVAILKDTAGGTGSSYTSGGNAAKWITLRDMTLTTTSSTSNLLTLDVVDWVELTRVRLLGTVSNSTSTATTGQNAIYARPHTNGIGNITNLVLSDCIFEGCDVGLVVNANGVRAIGCQFLNMSRAVVVDKTASSAVTKNIKLIGCTFDQVGKQAILVVDTTVTDNVSVMSSGNYFGDVGNGYNGNDFATTPVITFAGSFNYSTGDHFERSDADHYQQPRISWPSKGLQVGLDSQTGLRLGAKEYGQAREVVLSASQTNANTGIVLGNTDGAVRINYWLRNGLQEAYRTGHLDIVYHGVNIRYSDDFVETPDAALFTYPGPTGVTFTVQSISASAANVSYTSTSTGGGNLTYQITSLRQ
jgi:hypothetical protein